jgi:hypothetical protein
MQGTPLCYIKLVCTQSCACRLICDLPFDSEKRFLHLLGPGSSRRSIMARQRSAQQSRKIQGFRGIRPKSNEAILPQWSSSPCTVEPQDCHCGMRVQACRQPLAQRCHGHQPQGCAQVSTAQGVCTPSLVCWSSGNVAEQVLIPADEKAATAAALRRTWPAAEAGKHMRGRRPHARRASLVCCTAASRCQEATTALAHAM